MGDSNPADELSAGAEMQKDQAPETFSQSLSEAGARGGRPEYRPTLDESRVAGY